MSRGIPRPLKDIGGRLIRFVPISTLTYFKFSAHVAALRKLAVLWVLSSSPVLISALFSKVPEGSGSATVKFFLRLQSAIQPGDLYIYTASFVSPLLFLFFERFLAAERDGDEDFPERIKISFRKLFPGYGVFWTIAVLTLIFTMLTYAGLNASTEPSELTFLAVFARQFLPYLYVFSILCWYLTILDSIGAAPDYVGSVRREEEKGISEFHQRVHRGNKKGGLR